MLCPSSTEQVSVQSKLPQFTLRTLFLAISGLGVLFAVCNAIGLLASFGLLVFISLIALHIIGNALGTSLRDHAPVSPTHSGNYGDNPTSGHFSFALPPGVALPQSTSRLSQRTPLGWVIFLTTLVGLVAGGWLGSWILLNSAGTSLHGLALGAISSGVLGGFAGFLFGSFVKTWLSVWRQACRESDHFDKRRKLPSTYFPALRNDIAPALVADLDAG
jgi:hypothetical protein